MEAIFTKLSKDIEDHPQNKEMTEKGYIPIFSASSTAKIVIIGQAPGIKAQESKKPWNDKSGEQLRRWLKVTDEVFYDCNQLALVPMDFYFPGAGKTGDLPPRRGFAELWHSRIFDCMPNIELKILVGQYAQNYYLQDKKSTLTETVKHYKQYLSRSVLPLPHPSPRNNIWKKKNPWFEDEVVPQLQGQILKYLAE